MNEKYGVELELIMDKFNEKIETIKNKFRNIEDKKINVSVNTAQIQYIKQQIDEISSLLDYNSKKPFMSHEELLKTEAELEKLTNNYNKLINKQNELNTSSINANSSMSKGFDKVTNKIKRFGLALFSIRSIYSLVSRASSAYLSQDTELANKLQAVWVGLGAILEPIISAIANVLIKGVKYINVFIKALTGVDLLAKATAKSLNNTSKSAKALSKTLAGFDELTNLDTTTDTSSAENNPFDAFNNVKINEEVATFIENIGKKLKGAWEWFTDNWKNTVLGIVGVVGAVMLFKAVPKIFTAIFNIFTKKNPITTALTSWKQVFKGFFDSLGKAVKAIAILGGIALVIKQVTGLIKTFSESGLTLGEVAGLLGAVLGEVAIAFVAIAGASKLMDWQGLLGATVILGGFAIIINQVTDLLKAFSETGMTVGDVIGLMASIFVPIVALMGAVALLGPSMTAGLIPFIAIVTGISAILIVMKETLPTILEACSTFINAVAPSIESILETIGELITKIIYALGETLPPIIDSVGRVFDKIFNGIEKVVRSVGNVVNGVLEGIRKIIKQIGDTIEQVANTIINFINRLGPAINNFVDNIIKAVTKLVNFVVSAIEYLINRVIDGVNGIASVINQIPGINIEKKSYVNIPRFVPQLAVGTNYVPEDQLAYIHKGEAVIPKKFNSQEYFSGSDEETKGLLRQLIDRVDNIELHPYMKLEETSKAVINYANARSRQLGRSVFE